MKCALCNNDAVWDNGVWRHDVSTEEKMFKASSCNRYGYPIPVRDKDLNLLQADQPQVKPGLVQQWYALNIDLCKRAGVPIGQDMELGPANYAAYWTRESCADELEARDKEIRALLKELLCVQPPSEIRHKVNTILAKLGG